jgi:Tol biopolymer transport system component
VIAQFRGMSATWSPEGRSVAFLGYNSYGPNQVIVRDVSSAAERAYDIKELTNVSPRWFHDGSALVLALREETSNTAFFKLDLRNGALTRLFDGTTAARRRGTVVALSPDDKTIYVTDGPASVVGGAVPTVLAVDVASGTERTVVAFPAGEYVAVNSIAISPDGNTLLLSRGTPGVSGTPATMTIFRVGTDGQGVRPIVGPVSVQQGSCADKCIFTPDGHDVLFAARDGSSSWRLMRVAAEGGAAEPDGLDFSAVKFALPALTGDGPHFLAVSPDGKKIAFSLRTTMTTASWAIDNILAALPAR